MDDDEKETLIEAIRTALRMIIDPEIGQNLVDLGLIYDIAAEAGGSVRIAMTTTTQGCPASDYLRQAVENCVRQVPGVEYSEVRLTYDPPWTPDMMREMAQA